MASSAFWICTSSLASEKTRQIEAATVTVMLSCIKRSVQKPCWLMIMGDYAHQNIGEYQNVYVILDLSNIYELEFAPPRRTWGNRGGFI